MKTITTHTIELTGTHYEAGYHLGTWMSVHSPHKHICTAGFPGLAAPASMRSWPDSPMDLRLGRKTWFITP